MRTYGHVDWGKGEYEISDMRETAKDRAQRRMREAAFFRVSCEPHVMMRLKRVFDGVYKGAHKTADIMESPQAARDLLWFLDRYPMTVSPDARKRLWVRAGEYRDRLKVIDEVFAGDYKPQVHQLVKPLRDYQAIAVDLNLRSKGLLIADAAGLGKTVEGIALASHKLPALIVCYPHLMRQWQEKFQEFLPWPRVKLLSVGRGTLEDLQRWRGKPCPLPEVVICNYEKLHGWADALAGWIKLVVFDECQELRKNDSLKYAAAAMIAEMAELRCGLSATPIYNYGSEIWNVTNVLNPGCLGSSEEFGREWCDGAWGDKAKIKEPKTFGTFMREQGLMIRRTRRDVGREGPPSQIVVHKIDVKKPAHFEDLSALAKTILSKTEHPYTKMRAAADFDYKMRQQTGVAKAPHVAAFVRLLLQTKPKVLLYGWHHEVYDIWRRDLAEFEPVFYTGIESTAKKGKTIEAFVRGKSRVMCASLRAGAGLDGLQEVCDTTVIGELDWSPGRHKQCIWRLDRDGQMNPEGVTAYYAITEWGSDPVIIDTLGVKAGQADGMLDPDAEMIEQLQVDPEHMKKLARAYLERAKS